ncbi:GNAT family N-acetyltransferase [Alkaliphilus peptidifermentans]|uniref:N-acetyltransferase domain-containing protein n=1 Tax=Alkaliphilus peptidifermentans DSM 18978 TaxID=1120976 RepID=A0A1G5KLF2_9FIRM|nr:GNAT family N-acetyltransferase [Alkaliphilus peptidifermentans]SCZ01445.1 hypothetical protein SAMN03080606_03591 [Alkaliphilus peptidifermentans DSM 18978]
MIEIKKAEPQDKQNLVKLYNELSVPFTKEDDEVLSTIVIKDRSEILGIANFKKLSNKAAEIKLIYIVPRERGSKLGDGLLRGTINFLMENGYTFVLIKTNENLNDFLLHQGLVPLNEVSLFDELEIELRSLNLNNSAFFYCNPKEFFQRKCKGSRYR